MALAIYYVMRGEKGWTIRFDDREYGHNSLTSAMRASIAAARASAANGHEVQILVRWPDGSWVVSWTSEDDFQPEHPALGAESRAGPALAVSESTDLKMDSAQPAHKQP